MSIGRIIGIIFLGLITLGLLAMSIELLLNGNFSDHFWIGVIGMFAFGYVTYNVYRTGRKK